MAQCGIEMADSMAIPIGPVLLVSRMQTPELLVHSFRHHLTEFLILFSLI
jgi:hypothetical protein